MAGLGRGRLAALVLMAVTEIAAAAPAETANLRRIERSSPHRAAGLYCIAARAGNAEAAYALGRLYLAGRGVRRNAAMGAAWLHEAARLGKRNVRVPEVALRVRPNCRELDEILAPLEPPPEIAALTRTAAARHGLDPALVLAIMRLESGFDPRARSPKGAMGLMQLMPGTARRFGVAKPYDPADNLHGGCAYLRFLLELYDGDVRLAAAAYNAGEGAVARYRGVPPYGETLAYVAALKTLYPHARHHPGSGGKDVLSVEWSEKQAPAGLFGRPGMEP